MTNLTAIEILVTNKDGDVLHHRMGHIRAQYDSTRRAAYTRISNRLMRVFPEWKTINIKQVEG